MHDRYQPRGYELDAWASPIPKRPSTIRIPKMGPMHPRRCLCEQCSERKGKGR